MRQVICIKCQKWFGIYYFFSDRSLVRFLAAFDNLVLIFQLVTNNTIMLLVHKKFKQIIFPFHFTSMSLLRAKMCDTCAVLSGSVVHKAHICIYRLVKIVKKELFEKQIKKPWQVLRGEVFTMPHRFLPDSSHFSEIWWNPEELKMAKGPANIATLGVTYSGGIRPFRN